MSTATDDSGPLLAAALTNHAYGWPVIPVGPDKRPLCKWRQWLRRPQTEAEIRALAWDRADGLALLASPGSELVVLDFDGPHATTAWETTGIALPDTAQTQTRSGGHHLIYKVPNGAPTPDGDGNGADLNRRVRLVRAEGCGCAKPCGVDLLLKGYFIIPPTPGYAESPDFPLETGRVTTIPQAVLNLARDQKGSHQEPGAPTENWVQNALRGPISEGQRNETAARLAGHFLAKLGNHVDEVISLLELWAQTACVPPMDRRELRTTVESIAKREAARGKSGPNKKDQAAKLLELTEAATLFQDQQGEAYAVIPVRTRQETHRIRDRAFKRWLVGSFYDKTGKVPSSEALSSALNLFEAQAVYKGEHLTVGLRVAKRDGKFCYDLADPEWRAIEIDKNGWRVVPSAPLFRRAANTAAQVMPISGGRMDRVLDFANLESEDDKILLQVYLVACLVPDIPHPVLGISGAHGAAKSCTSQVIRRLVDPAVEERLSLSHEPNELALLLANNYLAAFDNLDGLFPWQSNMLARAATGGGIDKRRLYTDDEEIILKFQRCVVLNGINPAATRPDLLDRTIPFILERVPPERRREEQEFWVAFASASPEILGGMLDALVGAMAIYPNVKLSALPRMADFCRWGYAIAEALGIGGARFLEAYWRSIGETNEAAILGHPVAAAVMAFMEEQTEWDGTPAGLLAELEKVALGERIDTKARTWPKAAHILTRRLREVMTNLRDAGVNVVLDDRTGKGRRIVLRKSAGNSVTTVTSVTGQQTLTFSNDARGDGTSRDPGSVIGSDTVGGQRDQSPLRGQAGPDDASDATFPYSSEGGSPEGRAGLEEVEV